ncbi:MAG: hypothetical protein EU539_08310 [Promethearchaeota archaeon]|nr:MAG: hypothetical protein EU539_08310 [Candidatus Lokiarchaeota archaeon]
MSHEDNYASLLKVAKRWEHRFILDIIQNDEKLELILKEKEEFFESGFPRRISLSISSRENNYSITSFLIQKNHLNEEKYREIYNIKVQGDINFHKINQDLQEIVSGKDQTHFHPNYPNWMRIQ